MGDEAGKSMQIMLLCFEASEKEKKKGHGRWPVVTICFWIHTASLMEADHVFHENMRIKVEKMEPESGSST